MHEVSLILADNLPSLKFNNQWIIKPNLFILFTSYTIYSGLFYLLSDIMFCYTTGAGLQLTQLRATR